MVSVVSRTYKARIASSIWTTSQEMYAWLHLVALCCGLVKVACFIPLRRDDDHTEYNQFSGASKAALQIHGQTRMGDIITVMSY